MDHSHSVVGRLIPSAHSGADGDSDHAALALAQLRLSAELQHALAEISGPWAQRLQLCVEAVASCTGAALAR